MILGSIESFMLNYFMIKYNYLIIICTNHSDHKNQPVRRCGSIMIINRH